MGKIDKNIIPILVGSVICFLNRLINDYDGTELFKHSIIVNIICMLKMQKRFLKKY